MREGLSQRSRSLESIDRSIVGKVLLGNARAAETAWRFFATASTVRMVQAGECDEKALTG